MLTVHAPAALQNAAQELLKEIENPDRLTLTVEVKPIEKGLTVEKNGTTATIGYATTTAFLRGIGLLYKNADKDTFEICEYPRFATCGMMPDVSRGAVLTVESVKKMARLSALEGLNAMMLYTEDIFKMEKYPYFGRLRGAYSPEQFREMDAYCDALGIELIPCIQTLAHLEKMMSWPDMGAKYRDADNVLMVGEDATYELIDDMLATMSSNLKSRRIHIGMDEAHSLGMGRYLSKHGFRKRSDIMIEHLNRVIELCDKYGYKPRMWSDMFFRMHNDGEYCKHGIDLPEEVLSRVPATVTPMYWDYYSTDKTHYDEMFRQHKAFAAPPAFAGGDSSWYGLSPLNVYAQNASRAALQSAVENDVQEVFCTMWKDDGAICATFAALPTLFCYGEFNWTGTVSDDALENAMGKTIGFGYHDMMQLEQLNNVPGRDHYGNSTINPYRYMLLQSVLSGKFDFHVPDGSNGHFEKCEKLYADIKTRAGRYAYLVEPLEKLSAVLKVRAELGKQLHKAYNDGDRETLRTLQTVVIPGLYQPLKDFLASFRNQWLTENRIYGFQVMELRIGALIGQLEGVANLIGDYLDGRLERIEYLDEPRLSFTPENRVGNDGVAIGLNWWFGFIN